MAVTGEDLEKIIPTSNADGFLASANAFVNAKLLDKGLPSDLLDQVTLYLAAHLACLTEEGGGLKVDKLGDAQQSYRVPGDKDTGFASTRFGQTAMIMDTSGTLAGMSANKGLKALFTVVGNPSPVYGGNTEWADGSDS